MPILLDAGPSPFGWSKLSTFFRCERLYFLQKDRPWENAVDGPLARGSVGHLGLAHTYKRRQLEQEGADPDEYYPPADAMKLYIEKHQIDATAWRPAVEVVVRHQPISGKVLHVEEVFGATVKYSGGEKRLTARFDLVIERDGQVFIVDHKIVFKHDPGIVSRYSLSGQFLLAQIIGKKAWSNFGGVLIHALAAIPPYHSAQYLLPPTPGALASFPGAVREALARIDACEASGIWLPAFHEQVCLSSYGSCSEYDACSWQKP